MLDTFVIVSPNEIIFLAKSKWKQCVKSCNWIYGALFPLTLRSGENQESFFRFCLRRRAIRCGDICFSFNVIGEREEESLDW
ncbi:hypothetical protein VNO78_18005 [Psophocarpus tetragonolobus]|uniref:Uncharacterized protein n=1 Tax=Psophocarpus tetragonolobus TaxID=3891 RepID=A0AAN9SJT7_PSOTE